jgi:hypothetical protein
LPDAVGLHVYRRQTRQDERVVVDPDPRDPTAAIVTIRYKLVATGAANQLSLGVKLSG